MTTRILIWYLPELVNDGQQFYLEADYEPVAVRIYARVAPVKGDLQVDIKDDGVSIFEKPALLGQGLNSTDMAEDFKNNLAPMEEGSWVSMEVVATNGAGDITVQLELSSLVEDDA